MSTNLFLTLNDSPLVSRDSYSGFYRNFRMSYECMQQIRELEERLVKAEAVVSFYADQSNYTSITDGWKQYVSLTDKDFYYRMSNDNYPIKHGGKMAIEYFEELKKLKEQA